ncbi:hypothetical protein C8R47DRAFT_1295005 [Mycena vitilis]|nr:hypothetical protein C8R47DRAFT_1295005 [Mycena vitilis]
MGNFPDVYIPAQPLPNPSNVYEANSTLTLHEHTLPSAALAVLAERDNLLDDESLRLERGRNGRLINCGLHIAHPSLTSPTCQVKLLDPFATGLRDGRLAQVWKVQRGDELCVARIYDPLYTGEDLNDYDIFVCIARTVIAEAAAYECLRELQGNLIPGFIGCFSTIVDTTDADLFEETDRAMPGIPTQRSVYVVLLEYMPGADLTHRRPSPEYPVCGVHKRAVLRAVAVAWHEMALRHISHHDCAERNVILKTAVPSTEPFCEDSDCKLRFEIATVLLDAYSQAAPFPIAVIDFEDTGVIEKYAYLLAPEFEPGTFSPAWL